MGRGGRDGNPVQRSGRRSPTLDQGSQAKDAGLAASSVASALFRSHLLGESASVMCGLARLITSDSTPSHPRYPQCTAATPSHVSHFPESERYTCRWRWPVTQEAFIMTSYKNHRINIFSHNKIVESTVNPFPVGWRKKAGDHVKRLTAATAQKISSRCVYTCINMAGQLNVLNHTNIRALLPEPPNLMFETIHSQQRSAWTNVWMKLGSASGAFVCTFFLLTNSCKNS